MRRSALAPLFLTTILLAGCGGTGFPNFVGDITTVQRNVNQPKGDSANMRRIRAQAVDMPPLSVEPGNVWPGPVAAEPTLQDLERGPNAVRSAPEQPVPGSPGFRAPRGSSTPPGSTQPALPNEGTPPPVAARPNLPSARPAPPTGSVVQTPRGPAVNTGGNSNYGTYTTPNGQGAIMIPNGNGTSTLIHPDGSVDTVPTAR